MVHAVAGDEPLEGALVALLEHEDDIDPLAQGQTNQSGEVSFNVDPTGVTRVVVSPVNAYWPMIVNHPEKDVRVDCPAISFPRNRLDWWHRLLGIRKPDPQLGAQVRVGVLDTGLERHEALRHVVPVGAWIGGRYNREYNLTELDALHGTHVCGIIGARPRGEGLWGVAPGVSLLAGCVCEDGSSNQQDIALGILALAGEEGHQVDLLNLSLSATSRSNILLDAIAEAADLGCLCICSAGNTGSTVEWPAQSSLVVAVSAFGKLGVVPEGSLSASCLNEHETSVGGGALSFARFSCTGDGIDCCGPGVGIISTVPRWEGLDGPWWGVMDGTSMAAPAVCGVLAARLARSDPYLASRRDAARSQMVRQILLDACRSYGTWAAGVQGRGIPTVN